MELTMQNIQEQTIEQHYLMSNLVYNIEGELTNEIDSPINKLEHVVSLLRQGITDADNYNLIETKRSLEVIKIEIELLKNITKKHKITDRINYIINKLN